MKFYIETPRLILREFQTSDYEVLFDLDSNPEVNRFLGNKPLKTIAEAQAIVAYIQQQYEDHGIGRWAVIEKTTGNFVGWSGLKFITTLENGATHFYDVGYRFMPQYWGLGYATETAKAAIKYGFETMHLTEIVGTCHEENIASRTVLEKCGLQFVEKFVYDNEIPCDWLNITKDRYDTMDY
jgi:[ribosomal protein S5]-alanine N-acetyltransferase